MTHVAKLLAGIACVIALSSPAYAQYGTPPQPLGAPPPSRFELVGLAGYHISSDFNFTSGHATIDDSPSYGATLRFTPRPGQSVDLLWVIVPTKIQIFSPGSLGFGNGKGDLTINYFQIGGTQSIRRDRLEPYFGGTIGAALFSPSAVTLSGGTRLSGNDVLRFAFTLGGGLKVWLAKSVAIQLDARLLAPVWFSGASFYAGTGGAGLGVSGGIPVWEGNFTGGLVLAL